ncbi:hypothetical protein D3C74_473670 [compost metagenome]
MMWKSREPKSISGRAESAASSSARSASAATTRDSSAMEPMGRNSMATECSITPLPAAGSTTERTP